MAVKLGDVCSLMTGGTPSRSRKEYFDGGDIKWLVSGDIHKGEIYDCEGRITKEGLSNSNARLLPLNSIMIALNGQGKTRGTVAMLRTEATCNQSLVSIYPKDSTKVLPEWIYWNLHSRYNEIRRITGDSGNDRRGLNMVIIRNIDLPTIPSMETQRILVARINSAVEKIDQMIELTNTNMVNMASLKRSFHDKTLNIESGMKTTLGDVFTLRSGDFLPRKSMITSGQYNVIGGNGVNGKHDTFNRSGINIAIGRVGEKCGNVHYYEEKIWVTDNAFYIKDYKIDIDKRYLYFLLNHLDLRSYAKHSAQPVISYSGIKDIEITIPPKNDQQEIVQRINKNDRLLEDLTTKYSERLERLNALKDSLLAEAFAESAVK